MKNGKYTSKKLTEQGVKYIWFKDDKWHREGGPAREYINGTKEWWINGKLHRLDGPAIEFVSGKKIKNFGITMVNGYFIMVYPRILNDIVN